VFEKVQNIKKKIGLACIDYHIEDLVADRWNSVPLGARNTCVGQVARFIIFQSLIPANRLVTKLHSSKLWPETEVVDWAKTTPSLHLNFKNLTRAELIQYIDILIFRYCLGLSDFVDRNILVHDGVVYSIDEECWGSVICFRTLIPARSAQIRKWVSNPTNAAELTYKSWPVLNELHRQVIQDGAESIF
jgi:hypothetical protein